MDILIQVNLVFLCLALEVLLLLKWIMGHYEYGKMVNVLCPLVKNMRF